MSIIEGVLCENFVYLELVRRIRKQEIAGQVPWFAIDKRTSGELDFYVRSRIDNMDYGLEVKRGKTGQIQQMLCWKEESWILFIS